MFLAADHLIEIRLVYFLSKAIKSKNQKKLTRINFLKNKAKQISEFGYFLTKNK